MGLFSALFRSVSRLMLDGIFPVMVAFSLSDRLAKP
jgi:hypothetical protein